MTRVMMRLSESQAPDAAHVRWVSWNGDDAALSFLAACASPPGARLELALDATLPPSPQKLTVTVRVKVHRCRRQDDGSFLVDGRVFEARREARAALEALARSAAESAPG